MKENDHKILVFREIFKGLSLQKIRVDPLEKKLSRFETFD